MRVEKKQRSRIRENRQEIIDELEAQWGPFSFEYLRDVNNRRIGIVVAVPKNNGVSVGASFKNKVDEFRLKEGLSLALERATYSAGAFNFGEVPGYVKKEMEFFMGDYVLPMFNRSAKRWFVK